MARRFASEGAAADVADLDSDTLAQGGVEIEVGGRIVTHEVDVSDSARVCPWVATCHDVDGRIDVLVDDAGIVHDWRVETISDTDRDAVVSVNLTAAFCGARAVLPRMKERSYGRIVSMSSMSWRRNFGQANHVAAKAGIVGTTRTVALEGDRHGITASAIATGLTEAPMPASRNGPARDKLVGKVPLGHTGDPTDIAAAAAYLASAEAGYVTGVVLDVAGGIGIGSSIR